MSSPSGDAAEMRCLDVARHDNKGEVGMTRREERSG